MNLAPSVNAFACGQRNADRQVRAGFIAALVGLIANRCNVRTKLIVEFLGGYIASARIEVIGRIEKGLGRLPAPDWCYIPAVISPASSDSMVWIVLVEHYFTFDTNVEFPYTKFE